MKPRPFTQTDVQWLKSLRISPDDLCAICGGYGTLNDRLTCQACMGTGRTKAQTASEESQDK